MVQPGSTMCQLGPTIAEANEEGGGEFELNDRSDPPRL